LKRHQDIQHLRDLKGKSFMAVEETSFGGWLMAWREMKEAGLDPYSDFSSLQFGGTHDAVVYAGRDAKVDAGTVRTDTLERMQLEGKINPDDFHVIHEHGGARSICLFYTPPGNTPNGPWPKPSIPPIHWLKRLPSN
jgi:ABC-type phosphate/phosphonate transport system substrate-binding protein